MVIQLIYNLCDFQKRNLNSYLIDGMFVIFKSINFYSMFLDHHRFGDMNLNNVMSPESRADHYPFFTGVLNYKYVHYTESVMLIFFAVRVLSVLHGSMTYHDIGSTLDRSAWNVVGFLFLIGLATLATTPLMQAVFGQKIFDYKSPGEAFVSSWALHFVKGSIEDIMEDTNALGSGVLIVAFFYFLYFFMMKPFMIIN